MRTDFARLYTELGLRSDCSVAAFKRACRLRIGALHPDRVAGHAGGDGVGMPLDELLALYGAAMRFEHLHGRLPGAVSIAAEPQPVLVTPPPGDAANRAPGPTVQPMRDYVPTPATTGDATRPASGRRARQARVVVLAGAAAVLAWIVVRGSVEPAAQHPARVASQRSAPLDVDVVARPTQLALGMDRATVRTIQGAPIDGDASQWTYGPSWLRFERGKLADWHSSPLHPLKAASATPPPETPGAQ